MTRYRFAIIDRHPVTTTRVIFGGRSIRPKPIIPPATDSDYRIQWGTPAVLVEEEFRRQKS
jgi:hypothetical protein